MEQQLRRYFVGIISFGFVVTWIAVGALAAFLGVLAVVAATVVPALLGARRTRHRSTRRRTGDAAPRRTVTARPLTEERVEELPLVPDEPSLIIGVSN